MGRVILLALAALILGGCQFSYDDSASSGLKMGLTAGSSNPCDPCAVPAKP